MNRILTNRRRTLSAILALGLLSGVVSQLPAAPAGPSRALIAGPPASVSDQTGLQRSRMEARPTTSRARVVTVDPNAFDGERISMELFPDSTLTADYMDIGYTGTRYPCWTGRLPGGGSAVFIINGDRISGTVSCPAGNFEFYPADDGQCVVVQHQMQAFPECAAGYVTAPARAPGAPVLNKENVPANGDEDAAEPESTGGDPAQGDTPTANRVRVAVAYTSSSQTKTQTDFNRTMIEHIDLAVAESNTGYANSGVTMRMELACLYETAYTESTAIENDVDEFQAPSDGNADEIHTFRTNYDADMCCLIVDGRDTAWCGWAYGFTYTAYNNMFQATVYDCATGTFTFAHEFGHTQGCRHNNDNTLTPFAYGHGFRNGSNWRTIMGLANGTGATRLNYWSNPNINSPVSPFTAMGTPVNGGNFANDCRTALNVGDNTVVNHEATPVNSSAPTSDTFSSDESCDKVVTGTLTVGTFNANNGSRVSFRAGDKIVLTPGFRARIGSDFSARITTPLGDEPAGNNESQTQ